MTSSLFPGGTPDQPTPPAASKAEVRIFCDGACSGNPGPGGWACIVEKGAKRQELSGGRAKTTNNQMELQALIEGLRAVVAGTNVVIITDSEYLSKGITTWVAGWIRNGWRTSSGQAVKNIDQWQQLHALVQQRPFRVQWVRGHSGHPENERCDELARAAIRQLLAGGNPSTP